MFNKVTGHQFQSSRRLESSFGISVTKTGLTKKRLTPHPTNPMLKPHELKGKKLGQSVTNSVMVYNLLTLNVVRGNTINYT